MDEYRKVVLLERQREKFGEMSIMYIQTKRLEYDKKMMGPISLDITYLNQFSIIENSLNKQTEMDL